LRFRVIAVIIIILAAAAALIIYTRSGRVFNACPVKPNETVIRSEGKDVCSLSGRDSDEASASAGRTGSEEADTIGEPADTGEGEAFSDDPSAEGFAFPEYCGEPCVELNGNIPDFTDEEKETFTGEFYSDLDELGRCGPAQAMLEKSMMPLEERGEIGDIKPSGWNQAKYPGIVDSDPPFLYNRCHLIAYALTGQNANEKNLITGTRYMNIDGMLPFEQLTIYNMYRLGGHILYRVTPRFREDELVARGVEMEAWSVEDNGAGLCFHVYVFNVQPGIEIDYSDGSSREADN